MANKTLLVIGNGYDLQCGLKSSFSNFFDTKKYSVVNSIYSKSYDVNIWYLLLLYAFYTKKHPQIANCLTDFNDRLEFRGKPFLFPTPIDDILWMDVESFIKKMLFGKIDSREYLYGFFKSSTNTYLDMYWWLTNLKAKDVDNQSEGETLYFLRTYFERNKNPKLNALDFFRRELGEFEKDFAKYIKDLIDDDYKNRSKELLGKLLKDEFKSLSTTYILSFNYTKIDSSIVPNQRLIECTNIHGSIDDENGVIIGYDSSNERLSSTDGRIFMSKSGQKIIKATSIAKLPAKEEITKIVFYGHSLGSQDYAYFHALLDKYDIYNGRVVLEFCYSKHGDAEKEKTKYLSSVYALLNDYAQRSGKETEYKSLVSRLQLENRLIVKEIF